MKKSIRGFTIVELLIVIVVIGILAAITVVAYNGVQKRARDTQIRQGVSQIEKAILQYTIDHPDEPFKGSFGSVAAVGPDGCTDGSGVGFIASGTYPCTIEDTLNKAGLLPVGFIRKLPANPYFGNASQQGVSTVMLYRCNDQEYILLWTLFNPSSEDETSIATTQTRCSIGAHQSEFWGMRAAKAIRMAS